MEKRNINMGDVLMKKITVDILMGVAYKIQ